MRWWATTCSTGKVEECNAAKLTPSPSRVRGTSSWSTTQSSVNHIRRPPVHCIRKTTCAPRLPELPQYNGIWAHWFKFIQPQFLFFLQGVRIDLQSGAAGCEKGFVKCFLRVSQAIGLYCSCQAAKLSKGNFQETLYKTFSQPAALDCTLFGFFTTQSLTESF